MSGGRPTVGGSIGRPNAALFQRTLFVRLPGVRPAEVKSITVRGHMRFKRTIASRKSRRGWIGPCAIDQVRFIDHVLFTVQPARKVEFSSIRRKSTGKVHGGGAGDNPRREDLRRQPGRSLPEIGAAACANIHLHQVDFKFLGQAGANQQKLPSSSWSQPRITFSRPAGLIVFSQTSLPSASSLVIEINPTERPDQSLIQVPAAMYPPSAV